MQRAAQVFRVTHLQYRFNVIAKDNPGSYVFIFAARRECHDAGRVNQCHAIQSAQQALGDLDGGTRVVGNDHIFPGQAVEQR